MRNKTPQPPEVLKAQRTMRANYICIFIWWIILLIVISVPFVGGVVLESWEAFIFLITAIILPLTYISMYRVEVITSRIQQIENSHKIIDEHRWEEYQQILKKEGSND